MHWFRVHEGDVGDDLRFGKERMRMGSAAFRLTNADEDGEFALSEQQLASALDPRCTLRDLAGQAEEPKPKRFVGRPYFVWRDDLELARALNDRLAPNRA